MLAYLFLFLFFFLINDDYSEIVSILLFLSLAFENFVGYFGFDLWGFFWLEDSLTGYVVICWFESLRFRLQACMA